METVTSEDRRLRQEAKKLPKGAQWPFKPRAATEDDLDLIYAGWVDSLRGAWPFSKMSRQDFKRPQEHVIRGILARPNIETLIAAAPAGEPKFGFVCYEHMGDEFVLHYIYVRSTFREHNIASGLLQFAGCRPGTTPITASHWTRSIRELRQKWLLTYNPFLAWRAEK